MDAGAEGLLTQPLAHGLEGTLHLVHLAIDPGAAALFFAAAGPGGFKPRQDRSVQHAIGQRLPGLDLGALAARCRDQLAHRGQRVQVFDDHARVKHRLAAFHDQARHLAQRIGRGNLRVGGPHVFRQELVIQLLLGHDDANFAHVGAGDGADEFHEAGMCWDG
ncbi:hypothetical protein D9M68_842920 [compost metagenome]